MIFNLHGRAEAPKISAPRVPTRWVDDRSGNLFINQPVKSKACNAQIAGKNVLKPRINTENAERIREIENCEVIEGRPLP